ncbi:hypothetical protein K491DRAFT_778036 [Lophiostoma macrostomum CBS 122681]|uniref:Uncharacterized protein n=1 Tax=Lophiostoma macrostomum CBS 122681 TaxID=1314788 RepID=A0A6A6T8T8_9PLEO|nr:hypothetical protein K491DRAFT_778036 [Lophiostoma macrostomum CBS 122681]
MEKNDKKRLEQSMLDVQNRNRRVEHELQLERKWRQKKEAEVASLEQRILLGNSGGERALHLRRSDRFHELVQPLRPPRSNLDGLPPTADAANLLHSWTSFQESLSHIIDTAYVQDSALNVETVPSSFANFVAEVLGPKPNAPMRNPDWVGRPGDSLYSVHVLKAYAAYLLLGEVFLSRFPDFEKSGGLLDQFREDQVLINGPEAVASHEYMGYKSLAQTEHFTNDTLPTKAKEICKKLDSCMSQFSTGNITLHAAGESGSDTYSIERFMNCAKEALMLKLELLLSKPGYLIQWIQPNDKFDARFMDAVANTGPIDPALLGADGQIRETRVSHCIFPALVQYDMSPPHDVQSALLCNKSFVVKERQASEDFQMIGRAVVLLEGAGCNGVVGGLDV